MLRIVKMRLQVAVGMVGHREIGRVAVTRVRSRIRPEDPRGEHASALRPTIDREIVSQGAVEAAALVVDDPVDPEGEYVSEKIVLNTANVIVEDGWTHRGRDGFKRPLFGSHNNQQWTNLTVNPAVLAAVVSVAATRTYPVSLIRSRGVWFLKHSGGLLHIQAGRLFCERIQYRRRREELRQGDGLGAAREPDEVEGDGAAVVLGQLGRDLRVLVGPIPAQHRNMPFAEGAQNLVGVEYEALVGLARRAPSRREVHIDDPVLRAELFNGLRAPFLPDDVGGSCGRRPPTSS